MAPSGTGSLVFIDDGTSRMNSDMCRAQLSAQIQSNSAEMTGQSFRVQSDNGIL